jgi:hypothetical protein
MLVIDLLVPSLVQAHSGLKNYNTSSQTDTNHLFYRERKKDNTDVATGMNYGVASFFSWPKATCNGAIRELEAPDNYCLLLRVNTLNGCGQPSWHLSPRANP